MKRQVILLSLIALMVAGMSCSEKEEIVDNKSNQIPVQFDSQLSMLRTSTSGNITSWTSDDRVGVYMLRQGESLSAGAIVGGANNRQYVATPKDPATSATFAPSSSDQTIYYPQNVQYLDFVAYYPYIGSISDYVYPVNVSDQSNSSSLDVLWSSNVQNHQMSNPVEKVNLTFEHQLALLTIQVNASEEVDEATSAEAVINGMPVSASLSLADGALNTLVAGSFSAKTLSSSEEEVLAIFEAVIIPNSGTTNPDRTIIFTLDGKQYQWTIADTVAFAKGKHYTYVVTIVKSDLEVTGTVNEWIPESGEESTWPVVNEE